MQKPCPLKWCDEVPRIVKVAAFHYQVLCGCGFMGPEDEIGKGAARLWNTRKEGGHNGQTKN